MTGDSTAYPPGGSAAVTPEPGPRATSSNIDRKAPATYDEVCGINLVGIRTKADWVAAMVKLKGSRMPSELHAILSARLGMSNKPSSTAIEAATEPRSDPRVYRCWRIKASKITSWTGGKNSSRVKYWEVAFDYLLATVPDRHPFVAGALKQAGHKGVMKPVWLPEMLLKHDSRDALVRGWHDAWVRAEEKAPPAPMPQTGSPQVTIANFADPRDLNVHDAIPAKDARLSATPTPYVQRNHDTLLRAALAAAIANPGQPRLILATGSSAVGKTRACYEAIKTNNSLQDWTFRVPVTMKDLEGLLSAVADQTVVWLNETQSYLPRTGETDFVIGPLTNLLRDDSRKVIFIGSMWTSYWNEATGPSAYRPVSELLTGKRTTQRVAVPATFEQADQAALNEALRNDERLRAAVDLAGGLVGTKVIQTLAGGPQLVARYDELQQDDSPLARMRLACLNAAIDLRRVGWSEPIARGVLRTAADMYLAPADGADDDALFALALHEPDKPGAATGTGLLDQQVGVPALSLWVTPVPRSEHRYRVHDYLFEHGSGKRRLHRVPRGVWWAAARDNPSESDAAALARSAFTRAIWYLDHQLYSAGYQWLQRLEEMGGIDGNYSVDLFDHTDHAEGAQLFEMFAARGDVDQLARWSDARHDYACAQLANLLMLLGDVDGLASRRFYADDFFSPRYAHTLALRGDIAALRAEADLMHDYAAEWLSNIDHAEDESAALSYRVDNSDEGPRYAQLLSWLGDVHTLTVRADAGDDDAAFRLGEVLTARGETRTLQNRFVRGDPLAGYWLARTAAARRDISQLERLARAGVFEAARLLALTLDVDVREDEDGINGVSSDP